ncbi:MAG: hypothetical protein K1X64_05835 [Myxococcaceae bacterium]|nr:hypothetical protein [Myxococcaceae bacterium]
MTRTLAFSFCVAAASFGATAAAPRQMMAAVVVKGKVTIVDAAKRVAVTIDVPEFTAEDADLSPNQKVVAVTGRYKGQTRSRLYLLDATSHALTNVPTEAIGDHRAPRYLSDGSGFVFVAGLKDAVGGPDNPSRLHRYFQSTGKVVRVETKKNSCEFVVSHEH